VIINANCAEFAKEKAMDNRQREIHVVRIAQDVMKTLSMEHDMQTMYLICDALEPVWFTKIPRTPEYLLKLPLI